MIEEELVDGEFGNSDKVGSVSSGQSANGDDELERLRCSTS